MIRTTIIAVCLGLCATLFAQALPIGSFRGPSDDPDSDVGSMGLSSDDSSFNMGSMDDSSDSSSSNINSIDVSSNEASFNAGSMNVSSNDTVGFYNVLTPSTQKSYFVGIRRKASGENVCYGVLISPTHVLTSGCKQDQFKIWDLIKTPTRKQYAVIGSRYNSGSHDSDGSETIEIANYYEHKKYSNSGYRAFSIYELEKASKLTPVTLLDSETISLPQNTSLTTYGWANVNNEHVMTERILKTAASSVCDSQKISFKDSICTVTQSAADGCDIVNGSPLIINQGANEILIGLRYTYKEACGISGFPVAFTSFAGSLAWVKKSDHSASRWKKALDSLADAANDYVHDEITV